MTSTMHPNSDSTNAIALPSTEMSSPNFKAKKVTRSFSKSNLLPSKASLNKLVRSFSRSEFRSDSIIVKSAVFDVDAEIVAATLSARDNEQARLKAGRISVESSNGEHLSENQDDGQESAGPSPLNQMAGYQFGVGQQLETLLPRLRAIESLGSKVNLDTSVLQITVLKLERMAGMHYNFGHMLESSPMSSPDKITVVRKLYGLVMETLEDTRDVVRMCARVNFLLIKIEERSAIQFSARFIAPIMKTLTSLTTLSTLSSGNTEGCLENALDQTTTAATFASATAAVAANSMDTTSFTAMGSQMWQTTLWTMQQLFVSYRVFVQSINQFSEHQRCDTMEQEISLLLETDFKYAQESLIKAAELKELHSRVDYGGSLTKELNKTHVLGVNTHVNSDQNLKAARLFSYLTVDKRALVRTAKFKEQVYTVAHGTKERPVQVVLTSDLAYVCQIVDSAKDNNKDKDGHKEKSLKLLHAPVPISETEITTVPDVGPNNINIVMIRFYNDTVYILKADTSAERDEWVNTAKKLGISKPRRQSMEHHPQEVEDNEAAGRGGDAGDSESECSEDDEEEVDAGIRKKRGFFGRKSTASKSDPQDTDKIYEAYRAEEPRFEIRQLPRDRASTSPMEYHPRCGGRRHVHVLDVVALDLTTGQSTPCEFAVAMEAGNTYKRQDCAFFAVMRPGRDLIRPQTKYMTFIANIVNDHNGAGLTTTRLIEPPRAVDYYARSWLSPQVRFVFDFQTKSLYIANMYRLDFAKPEDLQNVQTFYNQVMHETTLFRPEFVSPLADQPRVATVAPDNIFLNLAYRSQHALKSFKVTGQEEQDIPMGGCHIEFRQMSLYPTALSVGFWNPGAMRDMAIGVAMNLDEKLSAVGRPIVRRSSANEITLFLLQKQVSLRQVMNKALVVSDKPVSKTLTWDEYRIAGSREDLNNLQGFLQGFFGRKGAEPVRDISETLALAHLACTEIRSEVDLERSNSASTFRLRSKSWLAAAAANDAVVTEQEEREQLQAKQQAAAEAIAKQEQHEMTERKRQQQRQQHQQQQCEVAQRQLQQQQQQHAKELQDKGIKSKKQEDSENDDDSDDDSSEGTPTASLLHFNPVNLGNTQIMDDGAISMFFKGGSAQDVLKAMSMSTSRQSLVKSTSARSLGAAFESWGDLRDSEESQALCPRPSRPPSNAPSVADLTKFWSKGSMAPLVVPVGVCLPATNAPNASKGSAAMSQSASTTSMRPNRNSVNSFSSRISISTCSSRYQSHAGGLNNFDVYGVTSPTILMKIQQLGQDMAGSACGSPTKEKDENGMVEFEQQLPVADLKKRWENMARSGL